MDLFAYAQIEDLEPLLEMNGIKDIARLRGLRLMAEEKIVPKEEIQKIIRSHIKDDLKAFFAYDPRFGLYEYSDWTDFKFRYYIKGDGTPRWNKIHGKFRKKIKFLIKKSKKNSREQYEMFNKYVGRDDVLYIHTRTGGDNWNYYECYKYLLEPWYLDHCTDSWDCTYADIYVKIDPETVKKLAEIQTAKEKDGDNNNGDV